MVADIYLMSRYKKQSEEHMVDMLQDHYQQLRKKLEEDDTKSEQIDVAYIAYQDALRKARAGAYFRDSYNPSNLAWLYGLNYWNEIENCVEGCLPVERALFWHDTLLRKPVATMVLTASLNNQLNEHLINQAAMSGKPLDFDEVYRPSLKIKSGNEDNGEDFRQSVAYFAGKMAEFSDLLHQSVELNEPLRWNV